MKPIVCVQGRPPRTSSLSLLVLLLWLVALLLLAGAPACSPELPVARNRSATADDEVLDDVRVTLEPPSDLQMAPPIVRVRLSFGSLGPVDLDRVFLVQGEVSAAHLRQITKGALSKALTARVVPSLTWLDEMTGDLVVAPFTSLSLGETYAVATGDPPFAVHLRVMPDDSLMHLERVWPPIDHSATLGLGVWCGPDDLPPLAFEDIETRLDPAGPAGFFRAGAVGGAGARCVRFETASDIQVDEEAAFVGPPSLALPQGTVRLDPRPFRKEAEPQSVKPLHCAAEEIPFGLGCARFEDDRLRGRSPEAPLLWVVAGAGLDRVFLTNEGAPFVLKPLPVETSISLDVSVLDPGGTLLRNVVSSTTLAPMAHIVLNEVLANPLGAEPGQEWVELVNDGSVPASLSRYVLQDLGGETQLPPAELAPGTYAIIVNDTFVGDDDLDRPPALGALIIRVPKLGKNGLSNSGEPLKLLDDGGRVVSRLPPGVGLKAGWSLARTTPSAPDDLTTSFQAAIPSPGGRNDL